MPGTGLLVASSMTWTSMVRGAGNGDVGASAPRVLDKMERIDHATMAQACGSPKRGLKIRVFRVNDSRCDLIGSVYSFAATNPGLSHSLGTAVAQVPRSVHSLIFVLGSTGYLLPNPTPLARVTTSSILAVFLGTPLQPVLPPLAGRESGTNQAHGGCVDFEIPHWPVRSRPNGRRARNFWVGRFPP